MVEMKKNSKKLLAATLSISILSSGIAMTGVSDYVFGKDQIVVAASTTNTYTTTAALNMRSGASTKHKVILTIPKGKAVTYISKSSTWYKVKYNGKTGYVSSKYIKISQNSNANTNIKSTNKIITYRTTADLNMRSGASTKHKKILTIPKGKSVSYISKSGSWYKVKYEGKTGYVSSKYLKDISGEVKLNVPFISQLTPTNAPMGCEGASLLMALKYKGKTNVSLKTFLDKMPLSKNNPYEGYSGSPYKVVENVYQSIFPKPLAEYGKKYNADVVNASGYSTTQLKSEIDKGNPVVVYVTNKFASPIWKDYNMGSAGKVKAIDNMHVVTLIGYDKKTGDYLVNDPNSKKVNQYWVSKSTFEKSYNHLKFAVVVR